MTDSHTPGPWQYRPNEYDDWGFVRALPLPGENIGHIVAVAKDTSVPFEAYAEYRERKVDPFEANARLIAAAPDHALICWAVCVAAGRWEPSSNGGEFCINGIRYSTKLDEFGCPVVNGPIRAAILKAQGTQS